MYKCNDNPIHCIGNCSRFGFVLKLIQYAKLRVAFELLRKCFGLGWKRKHNLVLSPWIWIFLAYQCQVSPLTNKWMYVRYQVFLPRPCNIPLLQCNLTCDMWWLWHNAFYFFFASQDTILHYVTQHLLCWRRNDNWHWIGRWEEFLLVIFPVKKLYYIGLILQYNDTFNWYWIDV